MRKPVFLARLSRTIRSDARGTTLVEFAILLPVLILLIAGGIELGRLAMIKSTLETVTSSAAREALVDLTVSEEDRDVALRRQISKGMSVFNTAPGQEMTIETKVYRNFGDTYPESYDDLNENGSYDGPSGSFAGEPFDDRNRNGVMDRATQREGLMGGVGDVVSYQVRFPVALLFSFLAGDWGMRDGIILESEVVLRNEPVRRTTRVR